MNILKLFEAHNQKFWKWLKQRREGIKAEQPQAPWEQFYKVSNSLSNQKNKRFWSTLLLSLLLLSLLSYRFW